PRRRLRLCLRAIPEAIYSTKFDRRGLLCKFLIASGLRLGLCLRQFFENFEASPQAMPQGK
ncbi:hypothetical protein T09_15369, partial [Trichinella sp. T9]